MPKTVESVAVLGGGFMGAGIAEVTALAGVPVVIRELPEFVDAAKGRLDKSLSGAVKRGKLDEDGKKKALELITYTSDLADVADRDIIIEAVPERIELKAEIFQELDKLVSADTIIASNTSSIPIAELASKISNPGRVVGLHFFSPVPVMKLVEIVRALDTDDNVVTAAHEFAQRLGKQTIETKDRSGFIVNFLLTPYLMAAVRMYEEGFASREDIDAGMRLGASHPMGPLTLIDFIGLDVINAVCMSLYNEFKQAEYAPPPLIKRMIAAGRLGRKTGRGFYEY